MKRCSSKFGDTFFVFFSNVVFQRAELFTIFVKHNRVLKINNIEPI